MLFANSLSEYSEDVNEYYKSFQMFIDKILYREDWRNNSQTLNLILYNNSTISNSTF